VELDGYEFHSSKQSFRSDRDNDAEALALDLPTVRITTDRIDDTPEKEARRLHTIFERRRPQAGGSAGVTGPRRLRDRAAPA
jgi:hypothetical protein